MDTNLGTGVGGAGVGGTMQAQQTTDTQSTGAVAFRPAASGESMAPAQASDYSPPVPLSSYTAPAQNPSLAAPNDALFDGLDPNSVGDATTGAQILANLIAQNGGNVNDLADVLFQSPKEPSEDDPHVQEFAQATGMSRGQVTKELKLIRQLVQTKMTPDQKKALKESLSEFTPQAGAETKAKATADLAKSLQALIKTLPDGPQKEALTAYVAKLTAGTPEGRAAVNKGPSQGGGGLGIGSVANKIATGVTTAMNQQVNDLAASVITKCVQDMVTFTPPLTPDQTNVLTQYIGALMTNPDLPNPLAAMGIKSSPDLNATVTSLKPIVMQQITSTFVSSQSSVETNQVATVNAIANSVEAKAGIANAKEVVKTATNLVKSLPDSPEKQTMLHYLAIISAAIDKLSDSINQMSAAESDLVRRMSLMKTSEQLLNSKIIMAETSKEEAAIQQQTHKKEKMGCFGQVMNHLMQIATLALCVASGPLAVFTMPLAISFLERQNMASGGGDAMDRGLIKANSKMKWGEKGISMGAAFLVGEIFMNGRGKAEMNRVGNKMNMDQWDWTKELATVDKVLNKYSGNDPISRSLVFVAEEVAATVLTGGNPLIFVNMQAEEGGPMDLALTDMGAFGTPPDPNKRAIGLCVMNVIVQVAAAIAFSIMTGGAGSETLVEAGANVAKTAAQVAAETSVETAEVGTEAAAESNEAASATTQVTTATTKTASVGDAVDASVDAGSTTAKSGAKDAGNAGKAGKTKWTTERKVTVGATITFGGITAEESVRTAVLQGAIYQLEKKIQQLNVEIQSMQELIDALTKMLDKVTSAVLNAIQENPNAILKLRTMQSSMFDQAGAATWQG